MARRQARRVLLRGGSSFTRRANNRPGRPLALIVCEDGKLTPMYLRSLCVHLSINSASVSIPSNRGSAPISVVDFAAEKSKQDGGYDQVFCVFDRDDHESYTRALQAAAAYAKRPAEPICMRTLVSVPCFEFWLLLHFERTTKPMRSCDEVVKHLARHVPGYTKGADQIIDLVLPFTDRALENAKWVRAQQKASGSANPLTHLDELIDYLKKIAAPIV